MPVILLVLLGILIAAPLIKILIATLSSEGLQAWSDVLVGRVSTNLWWRPLLTTLALGVGGAVFALLIGGLLAWLVVLTDMPGRNLVATLSTLPFMIPSFAGALAWVTVFRNGRIGGNVGLFEAHGISIPDWLAWGFLPTIIVLVAHYFSLAYTIIAAALGTVGADLIESARMAGASRARTLFGIILPIVTPALIASGSLVFAGVVANFATPAFLGLPVRMYTLSVRLFGLIDTGHTARGYVIALLLIAVAASLLFASDRYVSGRRAFTTVTGKGARVNRLALGVWRWPLFFLAALIGTMTSIVPVLVLLFSSLARQPGALFSDWTLHFWIGEKGGPLADGLPGLFRNPQIIEALWNTIRLGTVVAITTMALGLVVAYSIIRFKNRMLGTALSQLAFVPLLVPSIAFAAAYVALFGRPVGPFPSLYGTFALLVLAATAHNLPFAVQSARSVLGQVSKDIEESAVMAGANFFTRVIFITIPLAIRGLLAGGILVFVKMVRDLSLVVFLTTAVPVLSMLAYYYTGLGFMQYANAITLVILAICLAASFVVHLIQQRVRKWN
ncbi:ABC transporter permease [Candidimonas nitroreducens]|uniref:ABC transporter permease n=1 Tax=Candidimonas nitroreducens TaxID=683354 RepID=A0A225LXT2_9BURK|nr:ABC transporter permease [Candidimonas nitroreducens]